jgi:hypothetical protein
VTRISGLRILLTFVLAASTIASFILDWRLNHLLNPLWHPHARYHGALLLFMLAGVSATGIWLLWRKSAEPEVAIRTAALLNLSFWTPLFYITTVLPSATTWAGSAETDPRLHGSWITPNLEVAAALVVLNVAVIAMSLRGRGLYES